MHQTNAALAIDSEHEYRAIERTLLESTRGRWFLSEHGRRARRLDSALLEEAIGRLQSSIRQPPALLGQLKSEVDGLAAFIRDTRTALLSKPVARMDANSAASPAQTGTTAAMGILKAAETMHEAAWSLQARDVDPEGCEAIARNAALIYALSQQQAMESRRALDLAEALDTAITRLAALRDTITHELQVDVGDAVEIAALKPIA
ncbi:MAG: hypothetical protein C0511_04740 [Hyphomicrobium sp.]|nr:hypothetical protein [Hyphomicrobium sp.]PPC82956.1 MAG: hypothetical protein CTY40_03610 [Hyphomicrobium sp.]